jgi:predicted nucleic acid-binding protein
MVTDAIVDSSVIVALVTPEEYSEWASEITQNFEYFHILDLSFYEVANAIERKVSNRFDAKDVTAAFKRAEKMMNLFTVHKFSEVITDSLNKALEQKITVYDAAFLSLSEKLKIPFLTLDFKLTKILEDTKYDELIEFPIKTSHK